MRLAPRQRWFAIGLPFACVVAFALLACAGWWVAAGLAAAAYTFYSYGSTSHDLVHNNLGLPHGLNGFLLSLIELVGLRSGHAYRAAHLHHHARFPKTDDVEAAAAHGSLIGALLDGPLHQARVWWWAVRHARRDRGWIIMEGVASSMLLAAAVAVSPITPIPIVYATLVILGSWTFPLITSYLPHNPNGKNALTQTLRFRGKVAGFVFRQHLYHLEHHLYPAVPHQRWADLAHRLNPYLDRRGARAIYFGF